MKRLRKNYCFFQGNFSINSRVLFLDSSIVRPSANLSSKSSLTEYAVFSSATRGISSRFFIFKISSSTVSSSSDFNQSAISVFIYSMLFSIFCFFALNRSVSYIRNELNPQHSHFFITEVVTKLCQKNLHAVAFTFTHKLHKIGNDIFVKILVDIIINVEFSPL